MSNLDRQPQESQPQNLLESINNSPNELPVREKNATSDVIRFLSWVGGISLCLGLFLFGNGQPLTHVSFIIIAIIALAFSYKYPRPALWAFLIYLPFAGTVAYWVGNDHAAFHLAKDGFYFPALIAIIRESRQKKFPLIIPTQLKIPLCLLLAIALLTLIGVNGVQQLNANPTEKPILMGIFGLKVLMGYIPLIACSYYLIRNSKALHFLMRLQVAIAIICCILGLMQYWLVVTGRCPDNTGLADHLLLRANLQRKCLVGGALGYYPLENFIRLPGTFVSPWNWAWFLISSSCLCFGTALSDPKSFWRTTGWISLSLVVINAIICGQRTAILAVPMITILLVVITSHISKLKRVLIILFGILLFFGGTHLFFPSLVEQRVESVVSRWNASPPTNFVTEQAQWTTKNHRGYLGNGLGRATNSARALGSTRLIETYYPKLMYEIGPIGVLAFLGVVTTLILQGFKSVRQLRDPSLHGYGIVLWIFMVLISYNSYWYPLDTDPVAVYYWFFAGVLLKLPMIERKESQSISSSNPNNKPPKSLSFEIKPLKRRTRLL